MFASSEGKRLDADQIARLVESDLSQAKFSFCGPAALRRALQIGLRNHGVAASRFHYEEFEFRTGIGLRRLAQWVLEKSLARRAR